MANISRWDPFREFAMLQNRLTRPFRDPFAAWSDEEWDRSLAPQSFAPPVDVYEDDRKLTLKMEVPGVQQDDIDIRINNNMLTVSGERKLEHEEKQENFRRIERSYGSFTRSFNLPQNVDPNNCRADYKNGVLTIELEKRAESQARQIKIGSGASAQSQKTIEQQQPTSERKSSDKTKAA